MIDTRAKFDALVEEIREEERAKMLAAIHGDNGTTSPRSRPGRKPGRPVSAHTQRPAAPRPKGTKRSPEDIEALTRNLLAYVKKNSGQRIEQIATGLSVTTGDLALPAKKLLAEKKLKTAGQKRGTTYSAK
jgi:hypothetical protein